MTRTARFILPLGCLTAMMVACRGSEGPTGPIAEESRLSRGTGGGPLGGDEHEDTVVTLKRLTALASRITVTAVIGPEGGELWIPSAGGRIIFPAGAVAVPTVISMTAKAGLEVAYDFQPHMTFPVPVRVEQDLRTTQAARHPVMLSRLGGAYFEGDLERNYVDVSHLRTRVKELRAGSVDRERKLLVFYVNHFSGYLASSGRCVDPEDDR